MLYIWSISCAAGSNFIHPTEVEAPPVLVEAPVEDHEAPTALVEEPVEDQEAPPALVEAPPWRTTPRVIPYNGTSNGTVDIYVTW